jgi:MvaI/BcnI restriction endonuclease family
MRLLQGIELKNLSTLVESGLPFGLIEITQTGLSKGILDATLPFRDFLESEGVHDYSLQGQGPDSKIVLPALLLQPDGNFLVSGASLYRPLTKKGDPRIWFSNLKKLAEPGSVFCFIWHGNGFVGLNLRSVNLEEIINTKNDFSNTFSDLFNIRHSVHQELLSLMQEISEKGWIKGIRTGTTAVGHLMETELGIPANSSKNPDYKGIEIKSSAAKAKSGGRVNLFAKVATWPISPMKSSGQILKNFGYERGPDFKLYCTVSATNTNSQGLSFRYDEKSALLSEVSTNPLIPIVANWEEAILIRELANKHAETFWVKAKSQKRSDGVYFRYESVTHTKNPLLTQFIPLILSGDITMDHLIKKNASGKTSEKGPLFKIQAQKMSLLFPEPKYYNLFEGNT